MDGDRLADLNPLMDADSSFDKADFYETMTGLLVKDGKQYGWPYNYATTVLYYNTRLFAEAGVDFPTLDWTWNDLLENATGLTKDTGDPTTQQWGYLFRRVDLEHMSQSFGGNWVNPDEKRCDFTMPETIEALQFFSDLIYQHKVSPSAEQMGGQDEVALFASQRVAMVGLPEWGLLEFNRAHDEQGLEYDVMLMPQGAAGRKTRLRPGQITILKDTKDPQAAWELFKFAVSPEYEKAMQVEIPESPPPRKSVNEYKFKEFTTYPASRDLYLESPKYGIYPFYDLRYGKEMEDVIWPLMDTLMLGNQRDAAALAAELCETVDAKFAELADMGQERYLTAHVQRELANGLCCTDRSAVAPGAAAQ
jgi:multiple sugar transport system substrate-binding protein